MSPRRLRLALASLAVAGPLVLGACADAAGGGGGVDRGNEGGGEEGEGGGEEGEGGGDGY
jgi:hypothetical protein